LSVSFKVTRADAIGHFAASEAVTSALREAVGGTSRGGALVPCPRIVGRIKDMAVRVVRGVLLRAVRVPPREDDERRLIIVLWTAWNMGGTIRAAFNLAEYMQARGWEVEILSGYRDRDEPFFGDFPAGVRVTYLDDRRKGAVRGSHGLVRRLLSRRPSVFMPDSDRASTLFSVWNDIMLARLRVPGLRTIGLEQMNFGSHPKRVRRAIRRRYRELDALVVLTDQDRETYRELLNGDLPLHRIPNTVRPLPGAKADLAAKTVYAAGRFRSQKGFDLLIPAWAEIAPAHPDWTLRLRGRGRLEQRLKELVAEHGLEDSVTIEGPAEDIGADMAAASVFVLSSRFEGFPLILLEAMSKGMGIVSFDCPTGPADIVDDHRNGLLVPHEDVEGLSRAIRELVEDEELRRRTAAAAIETAEHYTIEAIGPLWEELFAELSREPRPSRA
jgi:glycosyltransferase involved in cell wall biosynthesis